MTSYRLTEKRSTYIMKTMGPYFLGDEMSEDEMTIDGDRVHGGTKGVPVMLSGLLETLTAVAAEEGA